MTRIEIIHASLSFIAILGILATIWFVPRNRMIALLVLVLSLLGTVSALMGIYLAVINHHPFLIFAGLLSFSLFGLSARTAYRYFKTRLDTNGNK